MIPETLPMSGIWRWENHYFFDENSKVMTRAFYEENYKANMHIHDFYEINIITDGRAIHYINGDRLEVGKGDIFVVPPGYCHGYYPLESLKLYHVVLNKDFFATYADDLKRLPAYPVLLTLEPVVKDEGRYHLHADDAALSAMRPQLDALAACYGDTTPEGAALQNSLGVYVVASLCRLCRISGEGASFSAGMLDAVRYLQRHFAEKLDIAYLCERTGVSRASFFRYFRQLTGFGPGEYLERYRLRKAMEFLCETNRSITEIAHMCGFYDSAHFIRRFSKLQGQTPSAYRAQLSKHALKDDPAHLVFEESAI